MRAPRALLAAAALAFAAACSGDTDGITTPSNASYDGGWVGTDNITGSTSNNGTGMGSGNLTEQTTGGLGSGNIAEPDTTDQEGFVGWAGSGN